MCKTKTDNGSRKHCSIEPEGPISADEDPKRYQASTLDATKDLEAQTIEKNLLIEEELVHLTAVDSSIMRRLLKEQDKIMATSLDAIHPASSKFETRHSISLTKDRPTFEKIETYLQSIIKSFGKKQIAC